MRLTVFTDYALRVMLVLASRTQELLTIADISGAFGISEAHLMKVTHVLGKTGWVETVRGRNGGMRLAADPRKLRLGQVVRQLEADFALVECLGEDNHCVLTGQCGLGAGAAAGAPGVFSTSCSATPWPTWWTAARRWRIWGCGNPSPGRPGPLRPNLS